MDRQIVLNYLFIFILPLCLGAGLRLLPGRHKYGWLVTAIAAVLTLAAYVISRNPPVIGSELYMLRAVQAACAAAGALITGLLLRAARRKR